jgi:hypothetical protein
MLRALALLLALVSLTTSASSETAPKHPRRPPSDRLNAGQESNAFSPAALAKQSVLGAQRRTRIGR